MNKLMSEFPNSFSFSISHTTRLPRSGEEHGKSYYFISVDEFKEMIEKNDFVEYNLYGYNYYGTSKKELQRIADFKKVKYFY
jgi:guanylate kinase